MGVDNALTSGHTVQILCHVPRMALLDIEDLIGTYNGLLYGRLSLLCLVLRCLLRLRNVYLFLEYVLLEPLRLLLLGILRVLRRLRCPKHALSALRRLNSLDHDLAALGLTAMLTLFYLNRLCICQVRFARQLVQIQVSLRRRLLCALRRVLLLIH